MNISFELVPSATVNVLDSHDHMIRCKMLLDTGSTCNIVTDKLANVIKSPKRKHSLYISGISSISTRSDYMTTLTFKSIHNEFKRSLDFYIVPSIADLIPEEHIPREELNIPNNIPLADPSFNEPAEIDMLIGSGPTLSLLCVGQIDLSHNNVELILQKTRLGWIIAGKHTIQKSSKFGRCFLLQNDFDLTRFWTIEEVSTRTHFSPEEEACEKHFASHVTRDEISGKFIVSLPFRKNIERLGTSRNIALKRLQMMEKRFLLDEDLANAYSQNIQEYIDLGHMSRINDPLQCEGFYLPHHAVIKQTSNFTKLRIVFDGSVKSNTGVSLNDTLMVGPTIQDDIFSLLTRFRMHCYVFTADIEKMYRQFFLKKEERKFQRILWRTKDEIADYVLNTITFGLSSSAFLAVRCLVQLASENKHEYPNASRIILKDTYVDNIITGTNNVAEARIIVHELVELLQSAKLNLREWTANDPTILEGIEHKCLNPKYNFDKENSTIRTLGVYWNVKADTFNFSVDSSDIARKITKRTILYEIAKIFDPLGLLGPVILYAKKIMQDLWSAKVEWDESLPSHIHTCWFNFVKQLQGLDQLSFDRRVLCLNHSNIQIHGFCDASLMGYGACIYIRTISSSGKISCNLLCSKSRVAPLKTMTIPRLELCGANLATSKFIK